MKSQIVIAALLSALSVPAFAGHAVAQAAKEMVPPWLTGNAVHLQDGKMAQESRFKGRAVYLNVGASVSTKDGRNIAITSNEVARLGSLLKKSTADDAAGVRCFSKLLHSVTETRAPIGARALGTRHEQTTSAQDASFCDVKRINFLKWIQPRPP